MYIDIDRYEPNSANVAQAGYKPGRLQRRRRAAQPGFILVRDCDRGTNSSNQHVPARTHEFRSNNATLTLYAGSNERFSSECIYIYVYIYIHIAHQVNFPEAAACQSSPAVQLQTNCVEAGMCQSGWQSLPTFLPTESRRPSSNEIAEGSRAVSHFRNVMYACQMYVSLCGCACWHDL